MPRKSVLLLLVHRMEKDVEWIVIAGQKKDHLQGLNGRQAAWAARKYKGHRVLPPGIMKELGKNIII
jgi:hypothetical protein